MGGHPHAGQVLLGGLAVTVSLAALAKLWLEIRRGLRKPDKAIFDLRSGGALVAESLKKHGVEHIFVLSGGHIAPIYCAAQELGINVVDVRHEVNTVFAADAMYRLTGVPGVAVITAGPGVTNTVTAVKNAQMAESAVVVLGGATGTILKGRGALQDIDHVTLMKPLVKLCLSPTTVAEIVPCVERAFRVCQEGVPGPVFVELPVDLTWPASEVVSGVEKMMPHPGKVINTVIRLYMFRHINKIYEGADRAFTSVPRPVCTYPPPRGVVKTVAALVKKSQRPIMVIGSQSMLVSGDAQALVHAVRKIGMPIYCTGMARGLMGAGQDSGLVFRQKRAEALQKADFVILAGAIMDFRLQYGHCISNSAQLVSVNRSRKSACMNRMPDVCVAADPALFLEALANHDGGTWVRNDAWVEELSTREAAKEGEIKNNGAQLPMEMLNPVRLCAELDRYLDAESILVMDGGDFVGTAANVVHPRGPLRWLDPGPFGTLGVGAGFAMAAKLARMDSEVWIFYGDGALGFSIAEIDTFVRFKMGIICVVGNDGGWTQILRDQEPKLGRATACQLAHSDYHLVAEGFGAKGFLVRKHEELEDVVQRAKVHARQGIPCLINCLVARNDFREGSISV